MPVRKREHSSASAARFLSLYDRPRLLMTWSKEDTLIVRRIIMDETIGPRSVPSLVSSVIEAMGQIGDRRIIRQIDHLVENGSLIRLTNGSVRRKTP